jgi:hypothetical protein
VNAVSVPFGAQRVAQKCCSRRVPQRSAKIMDAELGQRAATQKARQSRRRGGRQAAAKKADGAQQRKRQRSAHQRV